MFSFLTDSATAFTIRLAPVRVTSHRIYTPVKQPRMFLATCRLEYRRSRVSSSILSGVHRNGQ